MMPWAGLARLAIDQRVLYGNELESLRLSLINLLLQEGHNNYYYEQYQPIGLSAIIHSLGR